MSWWLVADIAIVSAIVGAVVAISYVVYYLRNKRWW
jgi:uncharacterized MnhB-related membrane protein